MKDFYEWLEAFEEQDPDWWKQKEPNGFELLRRKLAKQGPMHRDRNKIGYSTPDSLYTTPSSVPDSRRSEMEEIYAFQDRILDMAEGTPVEKLLQILDKINPKIAQKLRERLEERGNLSKRDLGITIYSEFETKGSIAGYVRLIQFLNQELKS